MAGYSGTPLPQKLGIKPDAHVALLGAPTGFEAELEPLPDAVRLLSSARAPLDVALLFATRRTDLEHRFARVAKALQPAGGLWVVWPKKTAGMATDLTENVVREVGLAAGLVDNKVCAVDETWSGLRFVIRLENRPARVAATAPSAPLRSRAPRTQSTTARGSRRARV
jgi:hypothetical protein